jgi:ankyrin repeat protein
MRNNKPIYIKGFDKDLKCMGKQYRVGRYYYLNEQNKKMEIGEWGFHFAKDIIPVMTFYSSTDSRYCIVKPLGDIQTAPSDYIYCTNKLKIEREITIEEMVNLFDVNKQKDRIGNTPLIQACLHNNYKMVKLLIEHGADVNIMNLDGNTPLMEACIHNNYKMVKLLIEHGVDVNAKDKCQETALMRACKHRNYKSVKFLIKNGANIKTTNHLGETPLGVACFRGNSKIAKLLLDNGADIGLNVLEDAYYYTWGIEKLLFKYGVDVNTRDKYQETALMRACKHRNYKSVKFLIKNGADVNLQDKYGETALSKAKITGHKKIIAFLKANGGKGE